MPYIAARALAFAAALSLADAQHVDWSHARTGERHSDAGLEFVPGLGESQPAPPVVLRSYWGPGMPRRTAPSQIVLQQVEDPPLQEVDPDEPLIRRAPPNRGRLQPPAMMPRAPFQVMRPPIAGVDPMVAVGRNYVIASQHGSLVFLDRAGNPLPAKNGIPANPSVDGIFADFVLRGGPLDLNEITGFPLPCDSPSYPITSGNRYCIEQFYDLRVWFDPGGNRFLLLAHIRNRLWTDIWMDNKTYTDSIGICGVHGVAGPAKLAPVPNASHCGLARRHAVFAISRTEDPRDGFYTYALTENNYQDWPWGAVNAEGNTFVIGHRGTEMKQGTAAVVFRLSDLRSGSSTPAWFKYYRQHLWGYLNPAPVVHHGASGSLGGLTLMVTSKQGAPGDSLLVFGFPAPTGQGTRPTPIRTAARLPGMDIPGWMARTVYRSGFLYTAWEAVQPNPQGFDILRVRTARVPLSFAGGALSLPLSAPAYRHAWLGKQTLGSALHDDLDPALAVNAAGDLLVAWHRSGGEQVLYALWPAQQSAPGAEITVHARTNPDYLYSEVHYAWAVTDPVDDLTWWFAHNGKKADGAPETLMVRVRP